MTRTPLSRSKGQRSRSPGRFAHRRVGASGGCNGGRGNVLAVGNCCYVAVCSAAQGASAPTGEQKGGGISWRPPAYSLFSILVCQSVCPSNNYNVHHSPASQYTDKSVGVIMKWPHTVSTIVAGWIFSCRRRCCVFSPN